MTYSYQVVVKDSKGNILDTYDFANRVDAEKKQKYLESFCGEVEVRDIWGSGSDKGSDDWSLLCDDYGPEAGWYRNGLGNKEIVIEYIKTIK